MFGHPVIQTNPHKANMKVAINTTMFGALFFVLTFILTVGQGKFRGWVLTQLVLAIPFLYVSIMTYSKIAYWKETRSWNFFGWLTSYTGSALILNAIGLMVAESERALALAYFIAVAVLMAGYSAINIMNKPSQVVSKVFKLLFFLTALGVGGILPLIIYW